MESLALLAVIVLFTSFVGGPVAILLTYLPDRPKSLRVFRTIIVCLLSLVGMLFGFQLAFSSGVPAFPKLIGLIGVITSIAALLFEFKVIKHKKRAIMVSSGTSKTYAVIFKSKRQDGNGDLYYEHNNLLEEKIKSLPGYIKHSGVRNPETRQGVTIAYFNSLEAIDKWRKDEEHMAAKKLAKSDFYENYSVEITEVIDSYSWDRESHQ
jgi:heme-degrading monooxygenase HmoA